MKIKKILILDGYTDEPAGLGVPPYIDVYPRYIAGAIWAVDKSINIRYMTVDQARSNLHGFLREANNYDLVVVIAGVTVPGKYLGGTPIRLKELDQWFRIITNPLKLLVGPAARFGIGEIGGRVAKLPKHVEANFDFIVKGDSELFVHELIAFGPERADPNKVREGYHEIEDFIRLGTKIVTQHPNYSYNLIAEIETFRGCPRWITGGCSFCIEPLYGEPNQRRIEDVVKEIELLYSFGVKHFRIGRQPDLFVYHAKGIGEVEFPKPNPEAIRKLFYGIRCVAPNLETLHIDNVNPGTVCHHPIESREIAKIIIEYHTPGDVAAMGIESADPKVVKLNNLKVYPDEAFEAIRIINEVGARRGWNGLPELLPGVNFVYGLIGETKETYILNLEFMKKVLNAGLMVRRINIRQVLAFPYTRMWNYGDSIIKKHKEFFKIYKQRMREEVDLPMLKRIVPIGTVLKKVFTETYKDKSTLARQVGSYPLLTEIPFKLKLRKWINVVIIGYGYRSVTGLPCPFNINTLPTRVLRMLPGVSREKLIFILRNRPFKDIKQLHQIIDKELLKCVKME